jgi:hypothetical protein
VLTSVEWARANLSAQEIVQVQEEAVAAPAPPASVPAFVVDLFTFPYPNGQAFVGGLRARGGQTAVNAAFRSPPVSTEQVLHPTRYPSDAPRDIEVPDLRSRLGKGWHDLDVQDVGEGWLLTLLQLRVSDSNAARDAAGWDGGQYRAWSRGDSTAVLLITAWDSPRDAEEFASGMRGWLGARTADVQQGGQQVAVLFASDPLTLTRLHQAALGP